MRLETEEDPIEPRPITQPSTITNERSTSKKSSKPSPAFIKQMTSGYIISASAMLCLAWLPNPINLITSLSLGLLGVTTHSIISIISDKSDNIHCLIRLKHVLRIIGYGAFTSAKLAFISLGSSFGTHQTVFMIPICLFWLVNICCSWPVLQIGNNKKLADYAVFFLRNAVSLLTTISLIMVDVKLEKDTKQTDWENTVMPIRTASFMLMCASLALLAGFINLLHRRCKYKSASKSEVFWSGFFFLNVAMLASCLFCLSYYFPDSMNRSSITSASQTCLVIFALAVIGLLILLMGGLGYIRCPRFKFTTQPPVILQQQDRQIRYSDDLRVLSGPLSDVVAVYSFPDFLTKQANHNETYTPITANEVHRMFPNTTTTDSKQVHKIVRVVSLGQQGFDEVGTHHVRHMSLMSPQKSPTRQAGLEVPQGEAGNGQTQRGMAYQYPADVATRLDTELTVDPSLKQASHQDQIRVSFSEAAGPNQAQQLVEGRHSQPQVAEICSSCQVCMTAHADSVFLPCGHGGQCTPCSKKIMQMSGKCCCCRKDIEMQVTVEPYVTTSTGLEISKVGPSSDTNRVVLRVKAATQRQPTTKH